MARNVVDIMWIDVRSPSIGHVELETVMEFSVTDSDGNAEAVPTLRRNRVAIGHKTGVPTYEIELKIKQTVPPEVDWYSIKRRRELVQFLYQEAAGRLPGDRYVVDDCLLTEISRSANPDGEVDMSVKFIPLDHRKES